MNPIAQVVIIMLFCFTVIAIVSIIAKTVENIKSQNNHRIVSAEELLAKINTEDQEQK